MAYLLLMETRIGTLLLNSFHVQFINSTFAITLIKKLEILKRSDFFCTNDKVS